MDTEDPRAFITIVSTCDNCCGFIGAQEVGMVATSRDELMAVTKREYTKLAALLEENDPGFALEKDPDGISIKNVIGHRAHWLGLMQGWYEDGCAGWSLLYPAAGYKSNDTRRYNSDVRLAQADLGWHHVRSMLDEGHQALIGLIMNATDLYGGPMSPSHKWTTGRWAEASGPSHYRSGAKYIRIRLRGAQKSR